MRFRATDEVEPLRTRTGSKTHLGYLAGTRVSPGASFYILGCGYSLDVDKVEFVDDIDAEITCKLCAVAGGRAEREVSFKYTS